MLLQAIYLFFVIIATTHIQPQTAIICVSSAEEEASGAEIQIW